MRTCCQYFNVLGAIANREIYRLALAKWPHFDDSKTSPDKHYPNWRRSKVIYDDQLTDITGNVEREIRLRLPDVTLALGIPAFKVGSFEIQLTSHNHGEYYRWHRDNGTRETQDRLITFVYYFHGLPRRFRGGELVIYQPDGQRVVIQPENDSIVFFSSSRKHEVAEVECPSKLFEDGRFTLNGWIRRTVAPRRDDYFGIRIFSPPARPEQCRSGGRQAIGGQSTTNSYPATADQTRLNRGEQRDASGSRSYPARCESLLNLYSNLYRQSCRASSVDVLREISQAEFYENYYFMNRPLILKGLAAKSPAVNTWSPEFFARNHGSVPVQITADRNSISDYEVSFRQTVRTVTLADFVQRICREGSTNDIYLVARNYFFQNAALTPLKSDLQPPPEIINTADQSPGSVKLWFGPKATVTPLHYDEHSILFIQIYGRKRLALIPSLNLPKLYARNKFYSAVDPNKVDVKQHPRFLGASLTEVTLEPGDILFIPVGWWHWAKSLDVSISATFCSFHVKGGNTSL